MGIYSLFVINLNYKIFARYRQLDFTRKLIVTVKTMFPYLRCNSPPIHICNFLHCNIDIWLTVNLNFIGECSIVHIKSSRRQVKNILYITGTYIRFQYCSIRNWQGTRKREFYTSRKWQCSKFRFTSLLVKYKFLAPIRYNLFEDF